MSTRDILMRGPISAGRSTGASRGSSGGQQDPVVAPGPATVSINAPTVASTKTNCKLKVQLVDEESKVLTKDTSNTAFTIGLK